MNSASTRRLRLRINSDERECTFAEFEGNDAVILLGDPGMGKTTLFKEVARLNYMTVRRFLINPHISNDVLFLDALDESIAIQKGRNIISEVAGKLCTLNKPKFRLSCRAADWYGSQNQEALSIASASGDIVIVELLPLTHEEIIDAVQELVSDPDVFIDEVESAGLGKLLGNPQTLILLARVWGGDRRPRNKYEVYDFGINELIKETNALHVSREVNSPDPRDLRKAAGAACSVLLLSNSMGISRVESETDAFVNLFNIPYENKSNLYEVLKRRLFSSIETDKFEPIHRTIAEFLAAEDLALRITNGLPMGRVMALMCGNDGKPVHWLRGLFAWLMCKIGSKAEYYVERDPYGVVTYGDASMLPPKAQCAIWESLQSLRDPWFLNHEIDLRTFRNLANQNTALSLKEILEDGMSTDHLKVSILEAIANSIENIGLEDVIRDIVLKTHNDNTWLRTTALRAYAKSVENDLALLEALDHELNQSVDDFTAPEVREELLSISPTFSNLASRILSILEQVASAKNERRIFGRFYSLIELPSVSDLDIILDGAKYVFTHETLNGYELKYLYNRWFIRRLENKTDITPEQLSSWLKYLKIGEDDCFKKALVILKSRFETDPLLFEKVFELHANSLSGEEPSFWLFLCHDIREYIPAEVWPVSQCEFFLAKAETENNLERAADLFRMYLGCLPNEGLSIDTANNGFNFINRRPYVEKILGNWKSREIPEGLTKRLQRNEDKCNDREKAIRYFTSHLDAIRNGVDEQALQFAAQAFMGLSVETNHIHNPYDRLVFLTSEEIADAFIQGFSEYLVNSAIPTKDDIVEGRSTNTFLISHLLLSISLYMRCKKGKAIPEEKIPHCIASAITAFYAQDTPDFIGTLMNWLFQYVNISPGIVIPVLRDIWLAEATKKQGNLSRFEEFSQNPETQAFLASLSFEILKAGINEDILSVRKIVSFLLLHDRRAVLEIGETELARNNLSQNLQIIWSTALFVIDPVRYLVQWKKLLSDSDEAIWEAIDIVRIDRHHSMYLTSTQRTEFITVVGKRYANVGHPSRGWTGNHNPWDASEFITNQISLIAADDSADADMQLEQLENDEGLQSYRDVIRHNKAQQEKRRRDALFSYASPAKVAEALLNLAPATPNDLLAYIIAHLDELSNELCHSQYDKYRAYWNEDGRTLINPKHEPHCSGFLADDLKHRVKAHSLNVTVEHHMVADKECDIVVMQGIERILPIEVKHHYHPELWTAWRTQLDTLYTRDAKANGLGIYLVLWSGEAKGRKIPKLPDGLSRPQNADELKKALESCIPEKDKNRLQVVVVDISGP